MCKQLCMQHRTHYDDLQEHFSMLRAERERQRRLELAEAETQAYAENAARQALGRRALIRLAGGMNTLLGSVTYTGR